MWTQDQRGRSIKWSRHRIRAAGVLSGVDTGSDVRKAGEGSALDTGSERQED